MQQVSSMSSVKNSIIEDPRTPLQKMRRRDLRAFCKHYNISYTPALPATELRNRIMDAGKTGLEPFSYPDRTAVPVQEPKPAPVERLDVSKLRPSQIRKICKDRGIITFADGSPITNRAKKTELLHVLANNPVVSAEKVHLDG